MGASNFPDGVPFASWAGGQVLGGYQQLPNMLVQNAAFLGLGSREFHFLACVASHAHGDGSKSFVGMSRIAAYMNTSVSTVKRIRQSLERKKLIATVTRYRDPSQKAASVAKRKGDRGRQTSNLWDLTPLLHKLNVLASDSDGAQKRTPTERSSGPNMGCNSEPPMGCKSGPVKDTYEDPTGEESTRESNYPLAPSGRGGVREDVKAGAKPQPASRDTHHEEMNESPQEVEDMARGDILKKAVEQATAKNQAQEVENERRRREKERRAHARKTDSTTVNTKGWYKRMYRVWKQHRLEHFPHVQVPRWTSKDYGQLKHLVNRHGQQVTELGLRYFIENWPKVFRTFFPKAEQVDIPTLGFLVKFDEKIMAMAQRAEAGEESTSIVASALTPKQRYEKAMKAMDDWLEANPGKDDYDIPADLQDEAQAAYKAMKDSQRR